MVGLKDVVECVYRRMTSHSMHDMCVCVCVCCVCVLCVCVCVFEGCCRVCVQKDDLPLYA